jgi:uncharacterized protein
MPSTLTYPGVYVEEIPSGVRTIVGVPTSVTAFLGRAPRGPTTGNGVPVFSFDDYQRTFGDLDLNYPMSFTIRDYFLNGGAQAVVVRLTGTPDNAPDAAAVAKNATLPGITSVSEGAWGNNLWVQQLVEVTDAETKKRFGLDTEPNTKLFNLTLVERVKVYDRRNKPADAKDTSTSTIFQVLRTETISNLVFKQTSNSPRRADRVIPSDPKLPSESQLLRAVKGDLADANPASDAFPFADPTGRAQAAEAAKPAPPVTPVPPGGTVPPAPPPGPAPPAPPDRRFGGDTAGNQGKDGGAVLKASDYTLEDRLDRVDIFNLMCLPPDTTDGDITNGVGSGALLQAALEYCVKRRAMLIIDPPKAWSSATGKAPVVLDPANTLLGLNLGGPETRNAALYFPRVKQTNPLRGGAIESFVPCGIIAGRMAQTDVTRGVWKAPAGIDVAVGGTTGLDYDLTDEENGLLNPIGINCLRTFPIYGRVVWGARTLRGADALADDYKYVPVRRLALYIEESLFRGTKWVVFEPNAEQLWAQIRANVGAFMQVLFRQGAFAGTTPQTAYFVNCDSTTNPEILVNQGVVTIKVGFAPLRPAEFVVIQLAQIVGTSG